MKYSRISTLFFFLSAIAIIFILYGVQLPMLSNGALFWGGFVFLGILGFSFGLLSVALDKKNMQNRNPAKSMYRYIGMFIVFVGLVFKIQYFPYSDTLLLVGLGVIIFSFFVKSKAYSTDENDVLDDF